MRLLAAPCRPMADEIACLAAVMEVVRAEARQYLLKIEDERLTLSCAARVRTRSEAADEPASTPADMYWDGFEFTCHSMMPAGAATRSTFAPPPPGHSACNRIESLCSGSPRGASARPAPLRPTGARLPSWVREPKQPLSSSHTRVAFNAPGASLAPAASRPTRSLHRNT